MKKINLYKSIVDDSIINDFVHQKGITLFNHSANSNSIDDFISVAYVLCPNIIEIDGYVFIEDFFIEKGDAALVKLSSLKKQFDFDKRKIEMWVNSWSFGDFFIGKDSESMENDKILKQFGDILVFNWTRRVKDLFPTKNIVVEYGEELMGELGLTITLYEK
ncbi:hypothetical protein G7062_08055 [Erysipelothrix sp. HDW6C]|uniref:hypothetical protein n=1 Tax=Erysipelothrix sp. HDW6C TaxID=2714930 RepID=UPI00140BFFC6|nr:hypothetical protein [Erysipelothrix sp. HDW6C]QIK70246.1 hypothetical protein G7062_08055 [Erysipelothrix sp. HDW6C]